MASKTTTDHEQIRKWVEARGGCPAHVKSTGKKGDPGILRIDYEGFSGVDTLEAIEWDQWFAAFDENRLAFVYDSSKKSRFSKLVSRSTASRAARANAKKKAASAKRTSSSKRPATAKRRATTARRASPKKRTKAPSKSTTTRKSVIARSRD